MSDAPNPFEAMMKAGQDWAKSVGMDDATAWPTMSADALEAMMGKTHNPEGLDAKTRLLMTLLGLTVLGGVAETQIKLTVRHAVAAGASKQEIAESIAMATAFGGAAGVAKAMELATEILDKEESGA